MLLEITLAIIFAKIFNVLFEKMKQPGVIGEIIAGILLGPCFIGALSGSSIILFGTSVFNLHLNLASPEFKEIAYIGVIFLLFTVGLEINMGELKKARRTGFFVGIFGIVIPFVLGYIVGMLFNMNAIQSAVVGTIFLATSTTMAIRILSDLDMLSTRVGLALYTVIVINDVIAMIIFALVFSTGNSFIVLLQVAFFFLFTIGVGLFIVAYTKKKKVTRKAPIIILTMGLVLCFIFASLAENMGITAIIGAFIAGLFIGRTPQANIIADYIKTIGYAFFIPLFFVWIGASFNFLYLIQSEQIVSLLFFIIIFVIFGLLGNFLGGFTGGRLSGLGRRESISIGIGMMPVMAVALIVVTTGIDRGMFGDPAGLLANKLRTATLFLILTSCLLTPALLKRSMRSPLFKRIGKSKTKPSFYHHPHCPECVSALRLDPSNNKWYCDTCQRYTEIRKKAPPYAPQGKEKTDKLIKYVIGAGTILLCGYVIQSSASMTLFEKISAIIGIFIGTTLAFLTIKLLFANKKTIS
ncbi:MAG: cation:proton antiporter [Thermoplasmata archaeon]|nr:cation:proton antiporter [Thermoplasmata archaeon]MBE3137033.1 cation:proton antiporter [Thermoplasmata archaeon]